MVIFYLDERERVGYILYQYNEAKGGYEIMTCSTETQPKLLVSVANCLSLNIFFISSIISHNARIIITLPVICC